MFYFKMAKSHQNIKKIYTNKSTFSLVKVSLNGKTIYLRLLSIKGCDAIRPKLNCFISMIISVAKLSGFPPLSTCFTRNRIRIGYQTPGKDR